MRTIIGLAGSLRTGSFNRSLLRAAAEAAPASLSVEVASIADIPLYNGDIEENEGIPRVVQSLKDRIAAADGLLLVTPEYNGSIPGVFKNAIDWLSRPPSDMGRVFSDKLVALMGATPGRGGTRLGQAAWLPVLSNLGARPWFGKSLYVAGAGRVFDSEGALVDDDVRKLLKAFMDAFAASLES